MSNMLTNIHPDSEIIERYSMEQLSGPELEAVENHLLLCAGCQDQVQAGDLYLQAVRFALTNQQNIPEQYSRFTRFRSQVYERFARSFAMPSTSWGAAGAAGFILSCLFISTQSHLHRPAIAITLAATRGENIVISDGPLDLRFDTRYVPARGPYKLQLLNAEGEQVWSATDIAAAKEYLRARVDQRLAPGQYFVRLTNVSGSEREYSLNVRRTK